MRFLLDTDITSYAIRGVYGLSRDVLARYPGRLYIAWPTETELLVWAYQSPFPFRRIAILREVERDVPILASTSEIQFRYARLKVSMLERGHPISQFDLLIAATALTHGAGDTQYTAFHPCSRTSLAGLDAA